MKNKGPIVEGSKIKSKFTEEAILVLDIFSKLSEKEFNLINDLNASRKKRYAKEILEWIDTNSPIMSKRIKEEYIERFIKC